MHDAPFPPLLVLPKIPWVPMDGILRSTSSSVCALDCVICAEVMTVIGAALVVLLVRRREPVTWTFSVAGEPALAFNGAVVDANGSGAIWASCVPAPSTEVLAELGAAANVVDPIGAKPGVTCGSDVCTSLGVEAATDEVEASCAKAGAAPSTGAKARAAIDPARPVRRLN